MIRIHLLRSHGTSGMSKPNQKSISMTGTLFRLLGIIGFAMYFGFYSHLARRGMREARECNSEGLLYVPMNTLDDKHALTRHQILTVLFTPLNEIDQLLLGTDAPARCMMSRID